jgi:hypothetical protein
MGTASINLRVSIRANFFLRCFKKIGGDVSARRKIKPLGDKGVGKGVLHFKMVLL